MHKYSKRSEQRLSTCHSDLQKVFYEVLNKIDHSILEGYRDKERQEKAFLEGKSKLQFPKSKHNLTPSMAVDVAPYPIDWNDTERFYLFAGFVLGTGYRLKKECIITHDIRWGGDWDRDFDVKDNTFDDLVHFELV
jgi:peptidoglycan L-alanyl-D-glutamate endopeptidase CwlK